MSHLFILHSAIYSPRHPGLLTKPSLFVGVERINAEPECLCPNRISRIIYWRLQPYPFRAVQSLPE